MANEDHVALLKQGAKRWNEWRKQCRRKRSRVTPDLYSAVLIGRQLDGFDLHGANLGGVDLSNASAQGARFDKAFLEEANLFSAVLTESRFWRALMAGVDLRRAILKKAILPLVDLTGANLAEADLRDADLRDACLRGANLWRANLSGARLLRASLKTANLVSCNLNDSDLSNAHVYGISAWNVSVDGAKQTDLVITRRGQSKITVDNLEVAQFIYLLLDNKRVRQIIDTLTSKIVLILGRFSPDRKAVLDQLKLKLRFLGYSPVLFDFEGPQTRDITETVSTLAHLSRFVIADITDARSIPQELSAIIPTLPSVPVQPIIQAGAAEYGMFEHFKRYAWVLPIFQYDDPMQLMSEIEAAIIRPAEELANRQRPPRWAPSLLRAQVAELFRRFFLALADFAAANHHVVVAGDAIHPDGTKGKLLEAHGCTPARFRRFFVAMA
jgi:pentapeptide repeat protein